ncbi:MAG: amidohydrolase family protein [Microbacterium sp.]
MKDSPKASRSDIPVRELAEITVKSDTRDYLSHATKQSMNHDHYDLVIDVDAHIHERSVWGEVLEYIENDVLKYTAQAMYSPGREPLSNQVPGMAFHAMAGRIPHQTGPQESVLDGETSGSSYYTQVARRAIDALGLDYQMVFPTSMLSVGLNPMDDIEIYTSRAYNRWLTERVLPEEKRLIGFLLLPFNNPEEAEKIVAEFGDRERVVGFTVPALRHRPVHSNRHMRLFRMIEETGKPLVFHAGPYWNDPSFAQLNRFVSMHALSFPHYNMIHMTNWIINAIPERFPKLKVVWIESGLAWIPFLMQRLDHEVSMRHNEAPGLKRLPSEYMKEMYFTSQPLERTNLKMLKYTMEMMNAETQLLYASDWPHWDFDPPSAITSLPFLSDQAKRNILGMNAAKLFNLPLKRMRPRPEDVLANRPQVS